MVPSARPSSSIALWMVKRRENRLKSEEEMDPTGTRRTPIRAASSIRIALTNGNRRNDHVNKPTEYHVIVRTDNVLM